MCCINLSFRYTVYDVEPPLHATCSPSETSPSRRRRVPLAGLVDRFGDIALVLTDATTATRLVRSGGGHLYVHDSEEAARAALALFVPERMSRSPQVLPCWQGRRANAPADPATDVFA